MQPMGEVYMSKILKIVFDKEGLNLNDDVNKLPIQEITYNVIRNIVLNYSQKNRGLVEEDRRKYYKICDVFEKAIKPQDNGELATEVKLDDDWLGFIKKCKKETMNPDRFLQKVEELIDAVEYR